MKDIRNKYLKLVELFKHNKSVAINGMIDMFQEVSNSDEHDIYHSIIQWVGLKGDIDTLNYIKK